MDTLNCPSCGAPLDCDPQAEGDSVRCPFCNSTVMLPGRRERVRTVVEQRVVYKRTGDGTAAKSGVIVSLVVMFVVCGVALFAYRQLSRPSRPSGVSTSKNNLTTPKTVGDGYAETVLSFGGEGIGPGRFKDARSIALDAEGHIYVGEYSGGRVQVFDPQGKFLTQWSVDAKMPLRGMAADRKGNVFVVQKGSITRYEGATGKSLGQFGSGAGFDDVTTTADGGLVAFARQTSDDIIRFGPDGQQTKVIRSAVSGQTERSELSIRVAADGLGNIYALGEFNNAVFKFTPDGRFVTQFGGEGDEAGQFRAPSAVGVDNQGRVYVCDFKGVQVFDTNGRYLGLIKVRGAASGVALNDRGELFVVARTQVYKFAPFSP